MNIENMYYVIFDEKCINKDLYNYVNEYIDKFYCHNNFNNLVDGKKYCGISVLNKKKDRKYDYSDYVESFNNKINNDIVNSNLFYVEEDYFVYYVIHFLHSSDYAVSVVDFEYINNEIVLSEAMLFDKGHYSDFTEEDFKDIDEFIFKV